MVLSIGYENTLEPLDDDTGKFAGYDWHHIDSTGKVCESFVSLKVHTVVREDPVTLMPSLDCPSCEAHGWVKDGLWGGPGIFEPPVWNIVAAGNGLWKFL